MSGQNLMVNYEVSDIKKQNTSAMTCQLQYIPNTIYNIKDSCLHTSKRFRQNLVVNYVISLVKKVDHVVPTEICKRNRRLLNDPKGLSYIVEMFEKEKLCYIPLSQLWVPFQHVPPIKSDGKIDEVMKVKYVYKKGLRSILHSHVVQRRSASQGGVIQAAYLEKHHGRLMIFCRSNTIIQKYKR